VRRRKSQKLANSCPNGINNLHASFLESVNAARKNARATRVFMTLSETQLRVREKMAKANTP
jgi:hypothetical protein